MIGFTLELLVISPVAGRKIQAKNCKNNVTMWCGLVGLEARCILSIQLYTQFNKIEHESNIQS